MPSKPRNVTLREVPDPVSISLRASWSTVEEEDGRVKFRLKLLIDPSNETDNWTLTKNKSLTFTGLQPNTTYYFKIRAESGSNSSEWVSSNKIRTRTNVSGEMINYFLLYNSANMQLQLDPPSSFGYLLYFYLTLVHLASTIFPFNKESVLVWHLAHLSLSAVHSETETLRINLEITVK